MEINATTTTTDIRRCPICNTELEYSEQGSRKTCSKCGYSEWFGPHRSNIKDDQASETPALGSGGYGGLYGWICPKCGAVLSPFTSCCPNCTKSNWEITCNIQPETDNKKYNIEQFLDNSKDKWGFK